MYNIQDSESEPDKLCSTFTTGWPNFKITLGSFLMSNSEFSPSLELVLAPRFSTSTFAPFPLAFPFPLAPFAPRPPEETGFRGGLGTGVVALDDFDLSLSVIDGAGGGARSVDRAEAATLSSGARIASVRSIHLREGALGPGRDGRAPLRFFVAFSSCSNQRKIDRHQESHLEGRK